MKRIRKILYVITILFVAFFFNKMNVYAATASVSISPDKTSYDVGDTVIATINVSETGGNLGSWLIKLSHSDGLNLSDGEEIISEAGDGQITQKSYEVKYKATKSGTASINVSSAKVSDWSTEDYINVTASNATINVKTLPKTFIQIDEPASNVSRSSNISIKGWVMSDTSNKKVSLYIDDKLLDENDVTFEARQDVINAITGYGSASDNPTPGYKASISNNKYKSGTHYFKVKVTNATNGSVILEQTKAFTLEDYKSFIQIDSTYNNDIVLGNNVKVYGWVMSNSSNKKVKIYYDSREISNVEYKARPDVTSAVTGYGSAEQNPTPGYEGIIPASYLSEGSHYITINLVNADTEEVLATKKTSINVVKPKYFIQIDNPKKTTITNADLYVSGWSMSNIVEKEIEIYLDSKKINNVEKYERPDVIRSITGYGSAEQNPTPGFKVTISKNDISVGNHTLTVKLKNLNTNTVIDQRVFSFEMKGLKSTMYIDEPTKDTFAKDSNIKIAGWSMSNIATKEIQIYIDNTKLENVLAKARPDVIRAVTGYGSAEDNPTPGYETTISAKTLTSGKHTIKIKLVNTNSNEVIKEISKSITIEKPKSQMYIDEPTKSSFAKDSNIKIAGWSMSNITTKEIQIYIDNTKLENVLAKARPDVIRAVTGYGSAEYNPTPGYETTISAKTLTSGKHTIKIKLVDTNSNEVINEIDKIITIEKPKSQMYVDEPTKSSFTKDSNIKIAGWSMSNITTKEIQIYIDNTKLENVLAKARPDVIRAVTGYGSAEYNPTPGYETTISAKTLTSGKHTIKIKLVDTTNTEVINEISKSITIEKPKSEMYVDEPTKSSFTKDSNIKIAGWSMSNIMSKEIQIYIDNTKLDNVLAKARPDVIRAVTGYGGLEYNPTPGYETTISAKTLTSGKHTIKIKLVDTTSTEVINEISKSITIEKPKSTIYIDSTANEIFKNEIYMYGWSMSNNIDKKVEAYIDNIKVENVLAKARPDVINAVTGYGNAEQNPTPGFEIRYDTASLSDGSHTLKVNLVDSDTNEVYATATKKFNVKKYDGTIYLDTPTGGNFSSEFVVSGWEMSELDNSYIKIYMDGTEIPFVINRVSREDVLNVVTDFGGRETNSTPGFKTTISIDNYNEGTHTLKIKLFTKLNEEIYTYTKNIFISKSVSYGIDISEYQTVYNWSLVKAYGIDYAIIRSVYRGHGAAGNLREDSKFYEHVRGASSVGLKLGTYVFSQAVNEQEARDEANKSIQMLNLAGGKSKFQMPVVFDAEYSSCAGHCGRADGLSKQQRTNVVKAFCETVKAAGYTPMIYASPNFFSNNLDMSQLSEYQVWVANYGVSSPYYSGPYQIWQYTSDGSVTGINGRVDMNYVYMRY